MTRQRGVVGGIDHDEPIGKGDWRLRPGIEFHLTQRGCNPGCSGDIQAQETRADGVRKSMDVKKPGFVRDRSLGQVEPSHAVLTTLPNVLPRGVLKGKRM